MGISDLLSEHPNTALAIGLLGFLLTAVPKIIALWDRWSAQRSGRNDIDLMRRKLELLKVYYEVEVVKKESGLQSLAVEEGIRPAVEQVLATEEPELAAVGRVRPEDGRGRLSQDETDAAAEVESAREAESAPPRKAWSWVQRLKALHPLVARLSLVVYSLVFGTVAIFFGFAAVGGIISISTGESGWSAILGVGLLVVFSVIAARNVKEAIRQGGALGDVPSET